MLIWLCVLLTITVIALAMTVMYLRRTIRTMRSLMTIVSLHRLDLSDGSSRLPDR